MDQRKIQATANTDHIEYGLANVQVYSSGVVLLNVIKKLLLFWGLALFSVFLPVVHFVLVPLFFILGIFFAAKARQIRQEIVSGEIRCPRCLKDVKIEKAQFRDAHKEICQHCACAMKIGFA